MVATTVRLDDVLKEAVDLESIPLEQVFEQLRCTREGLDSNDVQKRLDLFGYNKLEEKKESKILKFLGFMWNPLSWVMEAAAIMAIALAQGGGKDPDYHDFIGIIVLLIINSTISFIEENNAGNAAAALMARLAPKAKVLRDGKWSEEDAAVLVPGDIISIKLGDIIPADARLLEGDPLKIDQVRDLLKQKSAFKAASDSVSVIDGTQEGSYQWVTINYLLGNLGKKYSDTVGVVDLGGGSVQMAYAISETAAAKAPRISDGEDSYVKEMYLKGAKYHLYVHSYLNYGLLAARAEILKVSENSGNPCILVGYDGSYKYGGKEYKASASLSGSSVDGCRRVAIKALKVKESTCSHMKCTFGGVWNGGGGDGQRHLFVASFFFDRAAEAGFINPNEPVAKVRPANFEEAAKRACETKLVDAKSIYPRVEEDNLPYLCMDLVYQYTLLVDGFGLDPWQEITLVKQVKYGNSLVEAAWPLGSAIEAVSSLK